MATRQLAPVLRYIRRVSGAPADDSDRALLQRFARHGDTEAFAAVVRRHGPMVLGVCRRVLRHTYDADDAFQAVFLLLVRKAGSLRRPEQLGPWLHGVARRVAVKARSLGLRRRGREEPLADLPAPPSADDLIWSDLRPVLDDAVRSLPAKYRGPFVLCYLQGLTHAEAARHLGCPPGTIATRLSRARDQLRARLVRRGVTLSAGALAAALATRAEAAVAPALLGTVLQAVAPSASIPSHVTALTEGVCQAMLMEKLRFVVMALVAAAAAGAIVMGYRSGAAEPKDPPVIPPPAPLAAPPIRADQDGGSAVVETKNFSVTAPTRGQATLFAEAAERHRKEKAIAWLGKELPPWPQPCPITVRVTMAGTGGATTFEFAEEPDPAQSHVSELGSGGLTGTVVFQSKVKSRNMHLEGSLERLLLSALPHEVTHAVFADYFGKPVVRWADEGGAILSEDEDEQQRHEKLARTIVETPGRAIPLRRLVSQTDFPAEVMTLYAEGYSVTRFLVEKKDRKTFLAFVKQGMDDGWDKAVKEHYGFRDVEALEDAWLEVMRKGAENRSAVVSRMPVARTGLPEEGPLPGIARLQPDGKGVVLEVIRTKLNYQMALVRHGDGRAVSEMLPTVSHRQIEVAVSLSEVKAYHTDGTMIDSRQLPDLLKQEVPVLVAPDRSAVHPRFLQLLKEDTLLIVVKAAKLGEGQSEAPAAPAGR
jgi:RNA polymerase sigma factor (sigma-70 family)